MHGSPEETPVNLTYPGPHEGVTILATGQKVARGETVEIADEAVATQLLAQGWQPPKSKKSTTTPAPEATDKENV